MRFRWLHRPATTEIDPTRSHDGGADSRSWSAEEQAGHAVHEVPQGLTNGRIAHIRILARCVRMRLEGRAVAPPEPLPEELRKGKRPN